MAKIEAIRDLRNLVPGLSLIDAKSVVERAMDGWVSDLLAQADARVQLARQDAHYANDALNAARIEAGHANERIQALEEAITEHVLGRRLLPAVQHSTFPDNALPF